MAQFWELGPGVYNFYSVLILVIVWFFTIIMIVSLADKKYSNTEHGHCSEVLVVKQHYEWLKIDVFYSTIKRIGQKSHSTRSRAITFAPLPVKSCNTWRNDLPLPETCPTLPVALKAADIALVFDGKVHLQGLARGSEGQDCSAR